MGDGMLHVPAGKPFLLLEEQEKRRCIGTVHLHFLEPGEFGAEIQFAEFMDGVVGSGCLLAELVTGKVQDDQTPGVVLLV